MPQEGYSVEGVRGGARPSARRSAMICFKFSMPSSVKAVTDWSVPLQTYMRPSRVHIDRQVVEPILVLAEQFGDVGDGEDEGDGSQDQAARLTRASRGRQFQGKRSSSLWAG